MRKCTKCLEEKPLCEFYETNRLTAAGERYRLPTCKACNAAYYQANRERQIESNQRARIKRRYGLSWDEYQQLYAAGCAVCGSHERLHVDHDHGTGVTRGILCLNCNQMLGHAKDCPERLRKLADWVEAKPAIAQGLPGPSY